MGHSPLFLKSGKSPPDTVAIARINSAIPPDTSELSRLKHLRSGRLPNDADDRSFTAGIPRTFAANQEQKTLVRLGRLHFNVTLGYVFSGSARFRHLPHAHEHVDAFPRCDIGERTS